MCENSGWVSVCGRLQQRLEIYRALDQDRAKLASGFHMHMRILMDLLDGEIRTCRWVPTEYSRMGRGIVSCYERLGRREEIKAEHEQDLKVLLAVVVPGKESTANGKAPQHATLANVSKEQKMYSAQYCQTLHSNGMSQSTCTLTPGLVEGDSLVSAGASLENRFEMVNKLEEELISHINSRMSSSNSRYEGEVSDSDEALQSSFSMVAELEFVVHLLTSSFHHESVTAFTSRRIRQYEEADICERYLTTRGWTAVTRGRRNDRTRRHSDSLEGHICLHALSLLFRNQDAREAGGDWRVSGVQRSLNKLRDTHINALNSLCDLCKDKAEPPFTFSMSTRGKIKL